MQLLSRLFGSPSAFQLRATALPPLTELHHRELYKLLDAYYLNNGLYDFLAQAMYNASVWKEPLKGIRNPAKRVVEFYPAKLWPGALPAALPIVADNERIIEPIQQIWQWSNWGANKQLAARWLAKYGDLFIKVVRSEDGEQVYFQLINPMYISDFDTDHRGFITFIRVYIPQERRDADGVELYTHTEIWDRQAFTYRLWEHEHGIGAALGQIGEPVRVATLGEFGIDFVPFVHAKFMDIGDERGAGAFVLALDKIDEVNRKATRLAQMLFRYNKPLWALRANAMDASGRPLPAPRVGNGSGTGSDGDTIELGDDRLMRLPGQSELQGLVPDVNYQAHLEALRADLDDLEQDLPEIAYFRLREVGNVSGRAMQILLSAAIDRAMEVRGNAETALGRANAMALSMASNAGLDGFRNIGNYAAGDFRHSFGLRDVITLSDLELAEEQKIYVEMGAPLKTVLRRGGWSEADLKQMEDDQAEQQAQQQQTLASAILNAQRQMDSGAASNGLEQDQ